MFEPSKIILKANHADGTTTYLIASIALSYRTPKGKPRLAMEKRYHVYASMTEGSPVNGDKSLFHFTSKAKAISYFRSITK